MKAFTLLATVALIVPLTGCIDSTTDVPKPGPSPLLELAPGQSPAQMIEPPPGDPPRNPADLQRRSYTRFKAVEGVFGGQRAVVFRTLHRLPFDPDSQVQFAAVPGVQPDIAPIWKIERIELIGTMHDPVGRAYNLKPGEHWTMGEGFRSEAEPGKSKPSTRPLDDFETEALAAIRNGGTLSARVSGDRLRMLGAVRTVSGNCWQCHNVPEGTLMGAFSYDLRKIGEGKVPPPPKVEEIVAP